MCRVPGAAFNGREAKGGFVRGDYGATVTACAKLL